jgi:hypothetical protein
VSRCQLCVSRDLSVDLGRCVRVATLATISSTRKESETQIAKVTKAILSTTDSSAPHTTRRTRLGQHG